MLLRYGSAHELHRFRSRQAGCMHPTSCLLQQRACHGGKSRCLPARRVKLSDRKAAVPSAYATLDDQAATLLVAMPVCKPNLCLCQRCEFGVTSAFLKLVVGCDCAANVC